MENLDNNINKKDKIINSAIELFADKGFDRTSIRDISRLANTSVSMISYHFGGKEGLYNSILKNLFEKQVLYMNEFFEPEKFVHLSKTQKAEVFLNALDKIVDFLYSQMSSKLMVFLVKEQQNPKTAFMPPIIPFLRKIMADILDVEETSREVVYQTLFIVSQINSPRIISKFITPYGQGKFEEDDINLIKNNVKNYTKMIFQNAGIDL